MLNLLDGFNFKTIQIMKYRKEILRKKNLTFATTSCTRAYLSIRTFKNGFQNHQDCFVYVAPNNRRNFGITPLTGGVRHRSALANRAHHILVRSFAFENGLLKIYMKHSIHCLDCLRHDYGSIGISLLAWTPRGDGVLGDRRLFGVHLYCRLNLRVAK